MEATSTFSISIMSSTPFAIVTEQPQKGVADDDTSPAFTAPLPVIETSSASPAIAASSTGTALYASASEGSSNEEFYMGKHDNDSDGDRNRQPRPPSRGLDPTAEHLLIAAGAIGEPDRDVEIL
jgi:hypothetical protein